MLDLCVTIKGVSFLLQTGLGFLGNTLVLLAYTQVVYSEYRLQPVDIILCHLAFVDLLLLLTRCVPQTMTVFGLRDLLNDPGCKVVIYTYRITRALSVCITCMLSVFQAVTIAPAGGPSPLFSIAPRNGTVPAFTLNLGFCHVDFRDRLFYKINGVVVSTRDFVFVGLMLWSSGYILLLLHRHSRQVRSIRRSSQGGGAETRAAKTVITLVVLYVVFFGIDNIIWIYMLTVDKVSPVVADMKIFFSSCYACLSPFFIISSNKKVKSKLVCVAADQEQPSVDTQDSNDKM
ncbi:unnamed protein product [Oncorhynchus mykiss]|uniref:Vomeronasal type-1 receptor n=1 Tax=Oncorhynchus mykiss TaxID=8022 RepID=A0A060XE21_ONCMY|nr:unnamed protein product [Oncorhynchus mykiss]